MAIPEEIEEEKLEFLKREEIRTMQKDIAALREIEAQKEKERITKIKTGEKIQFPSKVKPKEVFPSETTLVPTPPKRPHPLRKALIRMAISLLLAFLLGFFYWFYFHREKSPPEEPPPEETSLPDQETVSGEEPPSLEEIVPEPEISVSPSLIIVNSTSTKEISEGENVLTLLQQLIQEDLPTDNFIRVVIKNTEENKILGLEDFLETISTTSPENIYAKLDNNFTLFYLFSVRGETNWFRNKNYRWGGTGRFVKILGTNHEV